VTFDAPWSLPYPFLIVRLTLRELASFSSDSTPVKGVGAPFSSVGYTAEDWMICNQVNYKSSAFLLFADEVMRGGVAL
jgi:hypothetical protein